MAQQKGKKVVVRRRRERKNIENGAVHIQSTFNRAMPFHGQAPADWASVVPESRLRLQHRPQQRLQLRQQWNTA